MIVFFVYMTHVFLNFSVAENHTAIVCAPLEEFQKSQNLENLTVALENRREILDFIKNAPQILKEKIETKDYDGVAIACGLIDDISAGFTKPCIDNNGTPIDIQTAKEICQNSLTN